MTQAKASEPQMTPMTQTPSRQSRYDAVVVGGGVNGLTCAAMLGKAGVRTLLVEQRDEVGGCAAESELAPGFRVPTLAHATAPVRRDVVEHLQLYLHGLAFRDTAIEMSSLSPDGRALTLWNDAARTAEGLAAWSARDAQRWPAFHQSLGRLGGLIGSLFQSAPPSIDAPNARDLFSLMGTLSAFRGLPKADQWRLLRWGPMAVADLVSESVENEQLRATLAADGIVGAMLGPWSAGSGLQLLLAAANRSLAWPGGTVVAGGPVAFARALRRAAERHGVAIRTGAGVQRIDVSAERAAGESVDPAQDAAGILLREARELDRVDTRYGDVGAEPIDDQRTQREPDALLEILCLGKGRKIDVGCELFCCRCHRSNSPHGHPRQPIRRNARAP